MTKILYAPWRTNYIKPLNKKIKDCPFCDQPKENHDPKYFILKKFKHCYAMLNLHPYTSGHLLVIPYKHVTNLEQLLKRERSELIEAINKSIMALTSTSNPNGFNVGLNLGGKAAGGSIPEHLHFHIVPRFFGDTSFMVSTADTQVISLNLKKLYNNLKVSFDKIIL